MNTTILIPEVVRLLRTFLSERAPQYLEGHVMYVSATRQGTKPISALTCTFWYFFVLLPEEEEEEEKRGEEKTENQK